MAAFSAETKWSYVLGRGLPNRRIDSGTDGASLYISDNDDGKKETDVGEKDKVEVDSGIFLCFD